MSLLERVEHTRERIHSLQALEERAARASEFEQRATTLTGIASALKPLCVPAEVLKEVGIEVAKLDQALLDQLQTKTALLNAAYSGNRSTILSPFPGQDFRFVFVAPCTALKQRTEEAFRNAWSEYVRTRTPAIDPEVLDVLFGVNALRPVVTSIQELLRQIGVHSAALPQSANEVEELNALCGQADQAWREIAGEGIALDVLEFLREAGSVVGAPYELLTPSILEWIDAHNLRRVLRIRLG